MAASVTLILWIFRDLGLGTAIIQTTGLDESLCTALFWTHAGFGVAMMIATIVAAPGAAWFYGEPALIPLLATMSVSFVFIGLGGLPRALLLRELRFHEVNRVDTSAAVLATIAMIASAAFEAGVFAFAVFLLVFEFVSAALAWRYCRWRPTSPPRSNGLGRLIRTGLHLTYYHALNFFSRQIETLAVGYALGAHSLGLYSRAGQLLNLPINHVADPLTQVTLGTLSRCAGDADEFRRQTITGSQIIAHLTLPVVALVIAAPETITHVVLGEQWFSAAPLLRWLAVSAAFSQITLISQAAAIAAGQTRKLALLSAVTLPAIAIAVVIGLKFGSEGVAISVAISSAALAWPRLWWRLRGSPVSTRQYLTTLFWPLIGAAAIAVAAGCGQFIGSPYGMAWQLIGTFSGASLAPLIAAIFFPPLRREWIATWYYLAAGRR